ncbi:MAG: SDR family NAD(P)-dependent oxidoreductase [Thermoplasmata archaeon]
MRVLVTGGAGFIGRHLVDILVEAGHEVTILDNRDARIHASEPKDLNPRATYVWKDIRDREAVREAGQGAEALYHLASLIEVAESERDIGRYVDVNVRGTAVLLDTLIQHVPSLETLVLTSSVAVYGEGAYACGEDGGVEPGTRRQEQLDAGVWEAVCPQCQGRLEPIGTAEGKVPNPVSVYGVTKLVQEKVFASASREAGLPAVVLRFGNVFGPGQREGAYAGVTTTFLRRIARGEPLTVHEDGRQTRDYVFVEDAVAAAVRALDAPIEGTWIGNIGSGRPTTVLEVAQLAAEVVGGEVSTRQEGTYRPGDIRHLWLDVAEARRSLGFEPSVDLKEGLRRTVAATHPESLEP